MDDFRTERARRSGNKGLERKKNHQKESKGCRKSQRPGADKPLNRNLFLQVQQKDDEEEEDDYLEEDEEDEDADEDWK